MASPLPRARRARAPLPMVVDLAEARETRRLRELQARCRGMDEMNRKSLVRLFQSGLVYTRQGARLGRDLLLAHQHLLRVSDLLARTAEPAARTGLVLARGR